MTEAVRHSKAAADINRRVEKEEEEVPYSRLPAAVSISDLWNTSKRPRDRNKRRKQATTSDASVATRRSDATRSKRNNHLSWGRVGDSKNKV